MEPMADEVDKYIEVLEKEQLNGKPICIKNHLEGKLNLLKYVRMEIDTIKINVNLSSRHEFEHHRKMRSWDGLGRVQQPQPSHQRGGRRAPRPIDSQFMVRQCPVSILLRLLPRASARYQHVLITLPKCTELSSFVSSWYVVDD